MDNIIDRLLAGGRPVLAELYQTYRSEFLNWVMIYRCTSEEAKDAYQSAVLTFYENVMSRKLTELSSSVKTYLFAIGKNKVMEMKRASGRFSELNGLEDSLPEEVTEENLPSPQLLKRVTLCLDKLGEPCATILKDFYYHCRNMEEIAKALNYKNTDTAKNQKYKCLLRLRKLFMEEQIA